MRKKTILGNYIKNEGVLFTPSALKYIKELDGYATVIDFLPGTKELYVEDGGSPICLSGAGCRWLQYLPMHENWSLTTFYDPAGRIMEWYFDISKGNFMDENGVPCTDDLFLDVVLLADGRSVTLDADELQQALDCGEIGIDDYRKAYRIGDEILSGKWNDTVLLTRLGEKLLSLFQQ
jgi:predicted RNA-binding protein associated with RNAse of E/G family